MKNLMDKNELKLIHKRRLTFFSNSCWMIGTCIDTGVRMMSGTVRTLSPAWTVTLRIRLDSTAHITILKIERHIFRACLFSRRFFYKTFIRSLEFMFLFWNFFHSTPTLAGGLSEDRRSWNRFSLNVLKIYKNLKKLCYK